MLITSATNAHIKNIISLKEKSKVRKSTGLFTVEGIKMFLEVPRDELKEIYVSESFEKENKDSLKGYSYNIVSDNMFKKISDTVTPQGVLAIVKQKKYTVEDIIEKRNKNGSCIVVLDRLQDPGNLGTIVRTGEGAGISGIIMSSDCADIYNPKVIRSTMGSIFRVPFAISHNLPEDIDAAHLKGDLYHNGVFNRDVALLIGNEARGLSQEVSQKADRLIKIPMEGKVESLNAAIATAILMYEAKAVRDKIQ